MKTRPRPRVRILARTWSCTADTIVTSCQEIVYAFLTDASFKRAESDENRSELEQFTDTANGWMHSPPNYRRGGTANPA